jgi:hypothetical protein
MCCVTGNTSLYLRELWFGDFFEEKECHKEFRMKSLRSHVHATWKDRHQDLSNEYVENLIAPYLSDQELWTNKIPSMLSGYFKDLGKLLTNMTAKLNKGATLGFVVSNSVYGGIPIPTDLLLAHTARSIGYTVESIDVYRGIIPSSQQYVAVKDKSLMRESLVILSWNQ